jgi:hypothetical protein
VGIEVLGPIFLGFTQWMMNRIREDDPDLVLFVARNGAFLLSAFERCVVNGPGRGAAIFTPRDARSSSPRSAHSTNARS